VIIKAKAMPSWGRGMKCGALRNLRDAFRNACRDFDDAPIKLSSTPAVSALKVVLIH
jgi:hypothetical protein